MQEQAVFEKYKNQFRGRLSKMGPVGTKWAIKDSKMVKKYSNSPLPPEYSSRKPLSAASSSSSYTAKKRNMLWNNP